jgi:hypothetical protein
VLQRGNRIRRRLLAFLAVQDGAKILIPSGLRQHPGPAEKRRLMPHMLSMATGQICHPIALFILMITDNGLVHEGTTICVSTVSQTAAPDVEPLSNRSIGVPCLHRSFQ